MHDAQLMDVLHAGRDVLEAEQHAALHPRLQELAGPSQLQCAQMIVGCCVWPAVFEIGVRSHSTDAL